MKNTHQLEITNISTEKDTTELQKICDTIGLKSYNEYFNFVVIQAIKSQLFKICNYNQEKADCILLDLNESKIKEFVNVKPDTNPLKCILTFNFEFISDSNKVILVN